VATRLQGLVVSFSPDTNAGLITAEDGQRYMFHRQEWQTGKYFPTAGLEVDFETMGNDARSIFVLEPLGDRSLMPSYGDRSRVVAILLALLLGTFGIHRFYLGQRKAGLIYLLFFWSGIPTLIGIVEAIWYLAIGEDGFDDRFN